MKGAWFALAFFFFISRALAQSPDSISHNLSQSDPAALRKGVEEIKAFIDAKPGEAASHLEKQWLDDLLRLKRYDDAADLALRAQLADPAQTGMVEALQRWRIQALLRGGKNAQALAAAKGLFNVASMESTGRALLVLTEALQAAHPDDPDIARRFMTQQIAGADAHWASAATTQPTWIMASIHVDVSDYQAALDKFDPDRFVINAQEYQDLTNRGNLLLLADRADEARANYERMLRIAIDDRQRAQANDGIARAIKAQAGAIGPANRWIDDLQAER